MRVVYTERLRRELNELEVYVAERASPDVAIAYVDRLTETLDGLDVLPDRYPLRPRFGPGVRAIVLEGRVTVFYRVTGDEVQLLAAFGPGQQQQAIKETP